MINTISRRNFVKLSAAGAAAMSLGLGVYSPKVQAFNTSIATMIFVDPITLEYKVFSSCCYFCADKMIVSHYQPTILCEVIKGGDSAIGGISTGVLSAAVDNNDYTSMHVRLWRLPDWAIDIAMAGQGCKMCGVDAAESRAVPSILNASLCTAGADAISSMLTNKVNDSLPDCFPKLLYTTETDPSWNTGCRDWLMFVPTDIECSGIGQMVTSMFGMSGFERCIGTKWGPLYPRQMATARDNPVVAAGIAAYRALHIARNSIGNLPFDTSMTIGKLQQTSPNVTVGFAPGSLLLDTAMLPSIVSPTHTYTFVWWLPVVCCKDYEEIFGFCTPRVPCT